METEIKELNLEEMLKNNEIDKIIELYNLEYELSLSIIDKLINLEKIKYIDKKLIMYAIDENFKKTLNSFSFEAPLKTREVLGKYFEEKEKNKRKQSYKNEKEKELETKLSNLKKGIVDITGEKIKGCYLNNKLIGFIKTNKEDDITHITKLYSKLKGEGIGTKLVNSLGDEEIKLEVLVNNPARFLYEKLGFKYIKNDEGKDFISDNNYKMFRNTKIKANKTR